jgi:TPR repeat protein
MFKSAVRTLLLCLAALPLVAQRPDPVALYERGMNALTGSGTSRNEYDAARYLRDSADLGYAPAQTALGALTERGIGVTPSQTDALALYKKAATQNDPIARWIVGRMYLFGEGVVRDRQEAEKWLQRSAESGNEFGQFLYGLAKEEVEWQEAPQWYRKAAMKGLVQAQRRLGLALKNGRGVNVDKAEAYQWLLLASENGDTAAGVELTALESDLVYAQLETIKKRVRELQVSTSRVANARGCTGWPGEFNEEPATPPAQTQKFCR